jgi:phospholipid-binding lipoprotein MlaA
MRVWGWIFLVLFILCGCSTTNNTKSEHADDDEFSLHEPDPLELFNRYMFGFNRILDAAIIKPAAIAYELGTPENFKYCTRSFIKNIYGPLNLVNYTLQGRIEKATTTTVRFILNTTLGFFGLIDFAYFIGIKEEPTSFNETLTTWGVEAGPYIMLPVLGPTTFRGMFGYGFDWFADPFKYFAYHSKSHHNSHHQFKHWLWGVTALDIINIRAGLLDSLDDIYETSTDPYVTIRSMIFQRQQKLEKKLGVNK